MSPGTGFFTFLVVTLLLLGGVVSTGYKGQRKPHFVLVGSAVAALGIAIYYAEHLGRLYDLEAAGAIYPVHLFLAKVTVAAYLLPVVTGLWTLKNYARKTVHRNAAFLVLTLTVSTAVTGTWMLLAAEPLDADPAPEQGRVPATPPSEAGSSRPPG